jgi:alpha,alpha-trehalase
MKDEKRIIGYYNAVCSRISLSRDISDEEKIRAGISAITEAESGEDFTPRFSHRAYEYAPVDLNSHLYGVEELLQTYYSDKDQDKSAYYEKAKTKRATLMRELMQDNDGVYHDYRYTDNTRNQVYACACFVPYMVGLAKDGIEKVVDRLQMDYGFAACEDLGEYGFQWGYPYVWAPHQYFAFKALNRVGKSEVAKQHAKDFLKIVEKAFEKTGSLWERYEKDGVAKGVEYKTQIMLGWTAGVYNVFYDTLKSGE